MSPAPLKPPPYTYPEWLKAGCPPLGLSVAQLAKWLEPPIARQRVNVFVQEGRLIREGKVIRTDHPVNLAFLRGREGAETHHRSPGSQGADGEAKKQAQGIWPEPPPRRVYQNHETEGLVIASLDMDAILDAI